MFSNNSDGIHIQISGGESWCQVVPGSNLPMRHETGRDGNLYAPCNNIQTPTYSASSIPVLNFTSPAQKSAPSSSGISPISFANPLNIGVPTTRFSPAGTPPPIPNLAPLFARQQQEAIQRQAIIQHAEEVERRQRAIAASVQQNEMDKLYIQGGLDAMRKEYERLKVGAEGPWSVYARAAYDALAAKEKAETDSTPAITKDANEYYEKDGINGLRGLVKHYEANGYLVAANIAKRILKQKEEKEREEEHNRRIQQDPEYAENYKIKEAEDEISKLEKEIKELSERDSFSGQQLNAAVIGRKKAFEYSKNLGYEGAKAYLKELQLPVNERFFDARVGASEAVRIFDKIIPLQNKIEQAKSKIQEIKNVRTERILKQKEEQEQERERTKQLLAKAEKEIEGLIFQEINLQMPVADEAQLRKIIRKKLEEYPTPESRREFIETLPDDVRLKAIQYTLPESSDGYQTVSAGLVISGLTTLIGATAILVADAYKDAIRNSQSSQLQEKFDESVYEPLDHSLDADSERNMDVHERPDLSLKERLTRAIDGYQPGGYHGADIGNTTPRFIPTQRHDDQGPGGYEPGREHNADIGNSTPGFTPMHNNFTSMERNKHKSKGSEDRPHRPNPDHGYNPAPSKEGRPGFSDWILKDPKTPNGAGGLRQRLESPDGKRIAEWDSQHGEYEIYDNKGKKHFGAYDPITGEQIKPPVPGRNIKKYI